MRGLAAHLREAVGREGVIHVGVWTPVAEDELVVASTFGIGRVVAVPPGSVDVDLRVDASLGHVAYRGGELLNAFARRPEVRVGGVVRIGVPPVPVEGRGHAGIFHEPLHGRNDVVDAPAVPHPQPDLPETREVPGLCTAVDRARPRPGPVQHRRLVPAATVEAEPAALLERLRGLLGAYRQRMLEPDGERPGTFLLPLVPGVGEALRPSVHVERWRVRVHERR